MIGYLEDLHGVTPERLIGFWAGWPSPPTPELHLRILAASEAVLLGMTRYGAMIKRRPEALASIG